MAAASYTTDLNLLTNAESGTWGEFSGYSNGGSPSTDTEYYIEGNGNVTQTFGTKTGAVFSIAFDYGSDLSASFVTGYCFFIWQIVIAGNAMDSYANGGMRVGIGADLTNFDMWISGGNNYGRNPYGGWHNIAVDPTVTADYTGGTGNGGAYRWFGSAVNLASQISKGNPHGVDVLRYGRGDLIVTDGDLANGYATFLGMATANDGQTARWGLFQAEGTGYLWKGLMSLGVTATSVDFRDANVNITVDDTPKTYAAFNKIEINNASSNVEWTAIGITAVDSTGLSLGSFEMVDNATVSMVSCTFTDMSTFIYQSNGDVSDSIFRRCGQVTQGGAPFDNTIFDESPASVAMVSSTSTIGDVTGCLFVSDGTGHAVNLGTVSTTTSCTWDNFLTGYAIQTGTAADRAILVNVASGQTLTINVTDRADSPTYYNTGTGTVSVVAGQKAFKFTVAPSITGYEWRIYSVTAIGSLDGSVELDGEETATADNQTYNYTYTADTPIAVQIISQPDEDYVEAVEYFTLRNGDQDVIINLETDNNN